MATDLWRLSAREIVRRVESGAVSVEALARACLDRIADREPEIHAWAHLSEARVVEIARHLDRTGPRGPLSGIPIGIKDIFDTADMPTAYGSPIYQGSRPFASAAPVAEAEAAGALLFGKTVTTEFAYFTPGETRNPRDTRRTPGGSSSGSAAAVADFMVPLAFGTQTAGSVIRPAAFCGIVGYKPSFGLIATAGVKPFAPSLDTVGVFARDVADAALFAEALTGRHFTAGLAADAAPTIGICRTPEWEAATPAMQAALDAAAHRLSAAGARVREVALPHAFSDLAEAQKCVMEVEGARALAFERTHHWTELSAKLRDLVERGLHMAPAEYDSARHLAARCRAMLDDSFGGADVLLAPSAPGEAPLGLAVTGDPVFNRLWTLLGVPCMNVPGLEGPDGLPLGVQAVGRADDDARALWAAAWVERHLR